MVLDSPVRVDVSGRVLLSRKHCAVLEEARLLPERYELVEGEVYSKMGQNLPHRTSVTRLLAHCFSLFGPEFVQTQANIDVALPETPINRPEPDVAVLNVPLTELEFDPIPEQIRLVAEVSDSSLKFDKTVKAALYARAGIAEYWIVDIAGRQLIVHREPRADGSWASVRELGEKETIAPLGSEQTVAVSELLP